MNDDALFLHVQEALKGRYSLLGELGRGGMGVVYLAHEVVLDRPVAIKILPPEYATSPARRDRFLREARAAAQLSHPNIVPIHTVDEAGGVVFYAMAYIEGTTLTRRIEQQGPLSAEQAARLLRDVAHALGYAHARGVTHRDVKPDNILLERATGRPLVADFGIARVAGATETGSGLAVGTPEYMSPEQASGERADGRSDLYALGAVGYFVLAGRPPFTGPDARAVMAKHISEPSPPVAAAAPGTPPRLARALDRCLQKDPAARFASGEELAEVLEATLERPRALPAPLERWVRSVEQIRLRHMLLAPPVTFAIVLSVDMLLDSLGGSRPLHGEPDVPFFEGVGFDSEPLMSLVVFVLPFVVYGAHRWLDVRRAVRAGFGPADFRAALRAEAARSASRGAEGEAPPGVPQRAFSGFAGAVVATLGLTTVAQCVSPNSIDVSILAVGAWLAVIGALMMARPVRAGGRGDDERADLDARTRLWSSRLGIWFARLAGLGLRRRGLPAAAATHRPTELALGAAVGAVFEALPKQLRAELPGVLEVVEHLESQAGRLRGRMAELDEMRVQADAAPAGRSGLGADDHHLQLLAELTGRRSVAEQQLESVVSALETLRLDLIRLRAGSVGTASITADLEEARRVGADIDAVIEGRAAVDRLLRPGPATA